jgi:hypothetical protein
MEVAFGIAPATAVLTFPRRRLLGVDHRPRSADDDPDEHPEEELAHSVTPVSLAFSRIARELRASYRAHTRATRRLAGCVVLNS